jgi:hypothetical protein
MLLTLPIFLPIIRSLGYDPVWFGILFNINTQTAYRSPAVRRRLLLLKAVAPPHGLAPVATGRTETNFPVQRLGANAPQGCEAAPSSCGNRRYWVFNLMCPQ